jgi:hypothetical protein
MTINTRRQEMFDMALIGVINQGVHSARKSRDGKYLQGSNPCQYRLGDQADSLIRCGIGHLIPDNRYDPDMEGIDVISLNEDYELFIESDISFLISIQTAHDLSLDEGMDGYVNRMKRVAEIYNLTYPE